MTYKEFIGLKGGFVETNREKDYADLKDFIAAADVDWRQKTGIVNPVQDQQQCGSCWAFSATAAVESRHAISSGTLLKLAEQQLVDCDRDQDQGCNGGLMDNAFTYLETNKFELESDYK